VVVLALAAGGGGGARAPTAGIDWLRLPLPYVANVCFRCFSCFKGMLQLFLIDVAKVDWRCCICCKYFRDMLQVFLQKFYLFQTYVASVLIRMFAYVSHICCNNMFYRFQTYVTSVLFGCYVCYNDYVASACFKCFICFSRICCSCFMLQK
jgi:hypothetical protein